MRALTFREEFDAVICYWNSFGYFSDADNAELLGSLAGALKVGGKLLLESRYLEGLLAYHQPRDELTHGGVTITEDRTWVPELSRMKSAVRFRSADGESRYQTSIRIYTYPELLGLFEQCGLVDLVGCETRTEKPIGLGARRLTLVGTRGR